MMTSADWRQLAARDFPAYARKIRAELAFLDRLIAEQEALEDPRPTWDEYAAAVAKGAPADLEALGVPQAFVRWTRAVEHVRSWKREIWDRYLRELWTLTGLVAMVAYQCRHQDVPTSLIPGEINAQLRHDWRRVADRYLPIALELLRRDRIDRVIAEAQHVSRAETPRRKVVYG